MVLAVLLCGSLEAQNLKSPKTLLMKKDGFNIMQSVTATGIEYEMVDQATNQTVATVATTDRRTYTMTMNSGGQDIQNKAKLVALDLVSQNGGNLVVNPAGAATASVPPAPPPQPVPGGVAGATNAGTGTPTAGGPNPFSPDGSGHWTSPDGTTIDFDVMNPEFKSPAIVIISPPPIPGFPAQKLAFNTHVKAGLLGMAYGGTGIHEDFNGLGWQLINAKRKGQFTEWVRMKQRFAKPLDEAEKAAAVLDSDPKKPTNAPNYEKMVKDVKGLLEWQ
ncbi:MAG TPA: hypothetical protein VH640_14500 [Bryobacteraceae bacterium]|jgi:hypothetical protein